MGDVTMQPVRLFVSLPQPPTLPMVPLARFSSFRISVDVSNVNMSPEFARFTVSPFMVPFPFVLFVFELLMRGKTCLILQIQLN